MAFKLLSCLNQHTNHRLDTFKCNFRIMKDSYYGAYKLTGNKAQTKRHDLLRQIAEESSEFRPETAERPLSTFLPPAGGKIFACGGLSVRV